MKLKFQHKLNSFYLRSSPGHPTVSLVAILTKQTTRGEVTNTFVFSPDEMKELVAWLNSCGEEPQPHIDPDEQLESHLAAREQQHIEDKEYYDQWGLHG